MDFYLSLERLDDAWTEALEALRQPAAPLQPHMDQPLRRLMEYLLYRHVGRAP